MRDGLELEQNEVVSVWIGTIDTPDEFGDYLSEDPGYYEAEVKGATDVAINNFAREFGFNWYDHDLQDAHFAGEQPVDLEKLLEGVSYAGSFLDEVLETAKASGISKANCFVCIYDFEYPAKMLPLKSKLEFLGAFEYQKI